MTKENTLCLIGSIIKSDVADYLNRVKINGMFLSTFQRRVFFILFQTPSLVLTYGNH